MSIGDFAEFGILSPEAIAAEVAGESLHCASDGYLVSNLS